MLAGFANTLDRRLCNAKFVEVGVHTVLQCTKPLDDGKEVFAFYDRTD